VRILTSEILTRVQSNNLTPSDLNILGTKSTNMAETINVMRRPAVEARTGLSRSTIYDWMKRAEFPQPVKLGARRVAWRESDITQWLESREIRAP
jgi:prophage regulatory protein